MFHKKESQVKILLHAFRNISFYLLGAGASAGIVPMTSELQKGIISKHKELLGHPANPKDPDELANRLIGHYNELLTFPINPDYPRSGS